MKKESWSYTQTESDWGAKKLHCKFDYYLLHLEHTKALFVSFSCKKTHLNSPHTCMHAHTPTPPHLKPEVRVSDWAYPLDAGRCSWANRTETRCPWRACPDPPPPTGEPAHSPSSLPQCHKSFNPLTALPLPQNLQPPNVTALPLLQNLQPPNITALLQNLQHPNVTALPQNLQPPNVTALPLLQNLQPPNVTALPLPQNLQPPNVTALPLLQNLQPPNVTALPLPQNLQPPNVTALPLLQNLQPPNVTALPLLQNLQPPNVTALPLLQNLQPPNVTALLQNLQPPNSSGHFCGQDYQKMLKSLFYNMFDTKPSSKRYWRSRIELRSFCIPAQCLTARPRWPTFFFYNTQLPASVPSATGPCFQSPYPSALTMCPLKWQEHFTLSVFNENYNSQQCVHMRQDVC